MSMYKLKKLFELPPLIGFGNSQRNSCMLKSLEYLTGFIIYKRLHWNMQISDH